MIEKLFASKHGDAYEQFDCAAYHEDGNGLIECIFGIGREGHVDGLHPVVQRQALLHSFAGNKKHGRGETHKRMQCKKWR